MPRSSRHASIRSLSAVAFLMLGAPMALAAESFLDTFDDGSASCWLGGTSWTEVVVEPSGGNDDGWLRSFATPGTTSAGIVTDKPEVGGDWLIAQVSGLQVDVRRVAGSLSGIGFRVREGGDVNGWFYAVPVQDLTDTWSTLVAPVDPAWSDEDALAAGWASEGPTVPSWQDTLASNYQLAFRAWGSPDLEMGYDNVQLTFDGPSCQSDTDEDRQVGLSDLLMVLSGWGQCECCAQDVNRDRSVDFADLVQLLADWGPCWVE